MTNGPHKHLCSICGLSFYCPIMVECFIENRYAVCEKPACIKEWEKGCLDEEFRWPAEWE